MRNIAMLFLLGLFSIVATGALAAPTGNPIVSTQNSTVAGNLVVKNSGPANLYGFSVTSGASSGYVLIFDSATDPGNGTVTPKNCYALPANSSTGASWGTYPEPFVNGITFVFSTTGCFTETESNTAFFSVQGK